MAVLSSREVLPRTFTHRFGEAPLAERTFSVTVDAPTPTQTIIDAVGILFDAQHPEYPYLRMLDASLNEIDRQHVEIVYKYELPKKDFTTNPLMRPDVWTFSTSGASVPFLFYYEGSGNDDVRPLVNSAGDFIEGLTVLAPEVQATISANRAQFPLAIAANITNALNQDAYLGGQPYSWQCSGISGQQATEIVDDQRVDYWQITTTLTYRQQGFIEKIPNVGWNYIEAGKKRRVWLWDDQGNERVDAGSPQPLDGNGGLLYPGGEGRPQQLQRRPYPAVNFANYFGTPNL